MALIQGKVGYTDSKSNNGYLIRAHYDQKYDIENNQSTVTIYLEAYNDRYAPTYADGKVYANDALVRTWQSRSYPDGPLTPNGDWAKVGGDEFTAVINHNQDGTGSMTISIGGTNWSEFRFVNGAYSHTNAKFTGSWTVTLDTIPRASAFTSASNIIIGENCNLKWIPNSPAFSYKIKFSIGSWSATTSVISPGRTTEYTYTGYRIPMDVANQLPKAVSSTMTATIYTYTNSSCTTQLGGENYITFTVSVPANIVPTISSVLATIDNSRNNVIMGWGVAVAGYTKVNLKASASGAYGSTIVSFTITGGYSTTITGSSLDWTGGYINSSGDKTFTIKVMDSRGRESVERTTSAITFYAYSNPQIEALRAERSAKNQNKILISTLWNISTVGNRNSALPTLKYKKSTESGWTTYNGNIANGSPVELLIDFDTTASYNFRLTILDAIGNSGQQECMISTMDVLLDFRAGGKGLGVGKVCETDAMEVSLPLKIFKTVSIIIDGDSVSLADYIRGVMDGTYV